jgi:signal transduction histidine kinase
MSRHSHVKLSFIALLAAAIIAIAGLAMLQYYWVDQVSVGERNRLQANVQLSAQRFSEDFDRELARAYLSLQMDAATLRDNAWDRYAQRVKDWRASTPYPGLISKIYLVEVNQIGRSSLMRFNADQQRFVHASWTPGLSHLRERFEQAYHSTFKTGVPQNEEQRLPIIAEDLPALVVGVSRSWMLSDEDSGIDADLLFSDLMLPTRPGSCASCQSATSRVPLFAYTVLMLDQQYIAETLLPDLAERYFSTESGLVYHLDVLSRGTGGIPIYRSDARQPAALLGGGDVSVGLFDISYTKLNRLLLDGSLRLEEPASDQPTGGRRIAIGILGSEDELSSDQGAPGYWELIVRHQAGSVDAAVAGLRWRNLLISFGTLLLLGVSVAMLVRSTRRAQHLARQQIEFASAVSHELRTPLAVICSAGENLADGLVHDPQKARQYGQVIYGEGRRLTEMVEQVLAFASAQSGQRCYNFHSTCVKQVVEGAVQALQVPLHDQGFTVELDLAPDLPLVQADAVALKRSVQNLISNALKYAQMGRWVGVSAAVAAGDNGPEICIGVRDRGAGIEAVDLPHIFEPFYRGRQAHNLQTPGSGLGLSLVRHTVEAHRGRIRVESSPGQGSTFMLYLPLTV